MVCGVYTCQLATAIWGKVSEFPSRIRTHRRTGPSHVKREIGILMPNNQCQHCIVHLQKDVLPNALCYLLCPVSAALASISRMDSISTSYR